MRIERQKDHYFWRFAAEGDQELDDVPEGYPGTPQEWAERTRALDKMLTDFRDARIDSRSWYGSQGPDGRFVYDPARGNLHRKVVERFLPQIEAAPRERKATLMAGLGGAGKTTLKQAPWSRINPRDFTIAADDSKDHMVDLGMVPSIRELAQRHPELVPRRADGSLWDFSPLELSSLVQMESKDIADQVASEAYRRGANVIWDYRMGRMPETLDKIKELNRHGYTDVGAFLVDVSPERSKRAARSRHSRGQSELYRGRSSRGGRYLPLFATTEQDPRPDSGKRSSSAEVFDQLTSQYSHLLPRGWAHVDNEDWENDGTFVVNAAGEWEGMTVPRRQLQPPTTTQLPAPRAAALQRVITAMNPEDPMHVDPDSVWGLLERFRDGEFDFDTLVRLEVQRFLSLRGVDRHPDRAEWSPYMLSEAGHDDDDIYWILEAPSIGILSEEESDILVRVINAALTGNPL